MTQYCLFLTGFLRNPGLPSVGENLVHYSLLVTSVRPTSGRNCYICLDATFHYHHISREIPLAHGYKHDQHGHCRYR